MTESRQQAFQQLRGPCVELSSVALKFKAHQSAVKDVAHALHTVSQILRQLGDADALDEKLAEYAFFPLTHIFNEAQRLSSSCLQSAVESITVLVTKGWRRQLVPQMGKQLLILMTLIAGADPKKQLEHPSEELKVAGFECIAALITQLSLRDDATTLFDDVSSKSVVDQLAYLLLQAINIEPSDQVQFAAAEALLALVSAITSRVMLASLLPRTASSLGQSLRTSTKSRRSRKVLTAYLKLLTAILQGVLSDAQVYPLPIQQQSSKEGEPDHSAALDETWLRATASQVKLVIIQVSKLKNHAHTDVRRAVADLCLTLITDCAKSLQETTGIAVETVLAVAASQDDYDLISVLETLVTTNPDILTVVAGGLYDWIQSVPRILQGNEDAPKQAVLGKIRVSFTLLTRTSRFPKDLLRNMMFKIHEGLVATEGLNASQPHPRTMSSNRLLVTEQSVLRSTPTDWFASLVMLNSAQAGSLQQLENLLASLHRDGFSNEMARIVIDRIPEMIGPGKVSGTWLALTCLTAESSRDHVLDFLEDSDASEDLDRLHITSELYSTVLPSLLNGDVLHADQDWRLTAMAIECTVLQAKQLALAYRSELMDTLYPILSLLGSTNLDLRNHAMTGLNQLARACKYPSTSDMLIDNVDYLINAVGMKLDSFDLSPQAPQVLLMMLRLCGARIVPYLDDLIGSILSALDNFHGYPDLVELLFQVLKVVVDESKKEPQLTITAGLNGIVHTKTREKYAGVTDVLTDLKQRKLRKQKVREAAQDVGGVPQKPWTTFESEVDKINGEERENSDNQAEDSAVQSAKKDEGRKLSKPHELLLSIARSTTPHLTSPSPQVRSLLLQLLEDISPLLARDENSFLPLINTVWPAVMPRLLDYEEDSSDAETSYNICAAADTIGVLCQGAGNFMSSRIDDIFPKLRKLLQQVQGNRPGYQTKGLALPGRDASFVAKPRSSRGMILSSLVRLLTIILSHVRLSADVGDEIVAMIAPYSKGNEGAGIREAIDVYNEDLFWLWSQVNTDGHNDGLGAGRNQDAPTTRA